jgi:hypothetical protein
MSETIEPFPWERDSELVMARANLMACAYNAAVNYGSDRAAKKMRRWLHCPAECQVRPGGLFHASDCENDFNHPVSQDRRRRAAELRPARHTYAASVSLVGRAS